MILALMMVGEKFSKERNLSYSDAIKMVRDGKVAELTIKGQNQHTRCQQQTTAPRAQRRQPFCENLHEEKVTYGLNKSPRGWVFQTLFPILSLGLAGFLIWMVFRQMQGASGRAQFWKITSEDARRSCKRVTFDDVAGLDEAKEELTEIVTLKINKVHSFRWPYPERRADDWPTRYWENTLGQGSGRRSRCTILLDLRFRFCRNVR